MFNVSRGYLSDGGVHNMAHIVAILGEIQSVSAFASKTYPIHGAEDTLASAVRMKSGAVGVINFTFVSSKTLISFIGIVLCP